MRGKPLLGFDFVGIRRITPADAGKTVFILLFFLEPRDHPRGCGENVCGLPYAFWDAGSPPRMRGKH